MGYAGITLKPSRNGRAFFVAVITKSIKIVSCNRQ
nr:MAG TPA: hypothetical protein [Caudoviricetes sp.]